MFELTRYPESATGGADVLVEVPHGATQTRHFNAVRRRLAGSYDNLEQFFYVNTDVGAPECAAAVARRLHRRAGLSVWVLRSLIPRTFIDCNRVVSHGAGGKVAGELTPGLPGYVREPADIELLSRMHADYWRSARSAFDTVCGEGGVGLILHTYAPRSVAVDRVDGDIVELLRDAYRPENFRRWPERPSAEVIGRTDDGTCLTDATVVADLRKGYEGIGIRLAENVTYSLHPGTAGYEHAARHPRRVLCVELNRGELGDPWTPFEPVAVGDAAVARLSDPLAEAVRAWALRVRYASS
jgi:hypothetical protein